MANGLFSSLFGTGRQTPGLPMDKGTAALTPDQASLQQLRQLMTGDVSKSLTGGERLMALGALLRSAARGSQVTPQEVMGQVRQTAQTRAATQLQLAQLQAAAQRQAKRDTAVQQYATTITDTKKREAFLGLPDEEQNKTLSEFVNPTPFQMTEKNGETYMVFRSGPPVKLDLPRDVERVGTPEYGYKFYYKGTTEPVIDPATGRPFAIPGEISPRDAVAFQQSAERIKQGWKGLALRATEGSGGGKEAKDIWVSGPDGKPMKVRGVSVGGNRYNVGGRVMEAVPSPSGGAGLWGDLSGVLDGTGKARFGGR